MEPGEGATLVWVVDRSVGTEGSPEPGPAVLGSLNLVRGGLAWEWPCSDPLPVLNLPHLHLSRKGIVLVLADYREPSQP